MIPRAAVLALLAALSLPRTGDTQTAPAQPAPAQPACGPRAPVLNFDLVDPEPRILPPIPAIALRGEAGGAADGTFPHHLGLTVSRVEWRTDITARSRGTERGPVCAVPAEVRLRLLHAEHTIRLARELPPGGCLAREVLAHERRHAEINRRTLRDAATELRATLRAWANSVEMRAPDVATAAQAMQEDLARALEPALARLRAAREEGHEAVDTPEEYRRLGRVCAEDQRRLRVALREP